MNQIDKDIKRLSNHSKNNLVLIIASMIAIISSMVLMFTGLLTIGLVVGLVPILFLIQRLINKLFKSDKNY